uniref:TAXI family TRAP transporter solute-binding subunit n=1 Tax=uncultured Methylobacterium sp. TaxID=157278 RepID=UPI0035CA4352
TGGSAENLDLLRAGKVDLALVQGEFAYAALAPQDGAPGLTVVAPMYATPGLFVVPSASPVTAVADLRGRPVALGTRNSGLTVMGRAVLAASGIDPEREIAPILLEHAGDGPAMVADGRAAALWGGGLGWPGFSAVADAPGGARFIGPSPEAIERVLTGRASLRRMTVPAGSFRGQDVAIETVGSWSLVLARPGLDPEAAHRLIAAIDRAGGGLARRLPQGRDSDPRNLAAAVLPAMLNPGTARYLAEIGAPAR